MAETPLEPVADDLWCVRQPLAMLGLPIGARMTVVRLPDGGLWLHSPISPTEAVRGAVDALGPVRHVVAPNRFHHLSATEWSPHHPEASVHRAPGLETKRPELAEATPLSDEPHPDWAPVLDQIVVGGMPLMNEVAFLHRPSRSLIQCDLAFHIGPNQPGLTRAVFRMLGAYDRVATTLVEKIVTRDRAAARASIERILDWDFDRLIPSHGEVFESGAKPAFREAWAWLLET